MEFSERYGTEDACRQRMFEARFPGGFICPICGARSCCYIIRRNVYQCNKCKHRTSLKAGTLMEKSRLPYKVWLWAIYLVATDKRGISAMELMRQLHVTYKTAWYLLHRIREAMGKADENCLLQGIVELDDGFFGGPKGGGTSGRGSKKIKVLVAVSKDEGGKPQRLKMQVAPNVQGRTVREFAKGSIAEQAIVETDAYRSYQNALAGKYKHKWQVYDADSEKLAWLHTIISNAKALINGTFHGLDRKYFQRYLNEFIYRFNRRFQQTSLFDQLLISVVSSTPLGLVALKG